MFINDWHNYNKECAKPNQYQLIPYLVEDKNAPVVIVCPGGGYRMIAAFIEGEPVAKYFQSRGLNAFVLRYHIKEKAHCPAPMEDIAHALNDVRDLYHLDISNYALCGFSAGGHMCGLFGTEEYGYNKYNLPKPSYLMLVYPVTSMEKGLTHWSTKKYFAGEDKEAFKVGNLYKHITPNYPKTFIWRGNKDRSVPPKDSDLLIDELLKNNIECKYHKYLHVGHGIGLAKGTEAEGWAKEAVDFWLEK